MAGLVATARLRELGKDVALFENGARPGDDAKVADITAGIDGSGAFAVTGDNKSNQVRMGADGSGIVVFGENGTTVNGHRSARAKLDSGDVITIGSTDLLFERSLLE